MIRAHVASQPSVRLSVYACPSNTENSEVCSSLRILSCLFSLSLVSPAAKTLRALEASRQLNRVLILTVDSDGMSLAV
jgi:hypothetical protein